MQIKEQIETLRGIGYITEVEVQKMFGLTSPTPLLSGTRKANLATGLVVIPALNGSKYEHRMYLKTTVEKALAKEPKNGAPSAAGTVDSFLLDAVALRTCVLADCLRAVVGHALMEDNIKAQVLEALKSVPTAEEVARLRAR